MKKFKNSGYMFVFVLWAVFMVLTPLRLMDGLYYAGYDVLMWTLTGMLRADSRIIVLEVDDRLNDIVTHSEDYEELREQYNHDDRAVRRALMARAIRRLDELGAAVIGLDLIYETSAHPDSDAKLMNAIKEADNVVLAAFRNVDLDQVGTLHPDISRYAAAKGIVNITEDSDGVMRNYAAGHLSGDEHYHSFAGAMYSVYRGLDDIELRDGGVEELRLGEPAKAFLGDIELPARRGSANIGVYPIIFRERSRIRHHSLFRLVDDYEYQQLLGTIEQDESNNYFRDAIVVVGTSELTSQDFYRAPHDKSRTLAGVYFHAFALNTLFDAEQAGRFFIWLSHNQVAFLLLPFGLAMAFILKRLTPFKGIIVVTLVSAAMFYFSFQLFRNYIWFDFLNPVLFVFTLYIADVAIKFILEKREKDKIRGAFANYVHPDLVAEIIRDPSKLKLGGEKRELTVLFSDVAGFTTISEMLSPEKLVTLLNEYLNDMTEIVLETNGLVDKFIGDAVMAVWGAPLPLDEHAELGIETALRMLERLTILQEKWRSEGWPEVDIRIGLNTGEMIAGNMGCEQRKDYTVIGDAVNLAARLEGINKQYGTRITISEFTLAKIGDRFVTRPTDSVKVKGKMLPVKIYEVVGRAGEVPETRLKQLAIFEEGLELYLNQKWDEAIAAFRRALKLKSDDLCCQLYIDRCEALKVEPPGEDWDGVCTMTTK